jgi:hypothetical protein
VIGLVTGNGAERPPAGKRQNSSALRFGARAINFSYPHLEQVTARDKASENRVGRQINALEDWRAQAFLQATFDRFEVADHAASLRFGLDRDDTSALASTFTEDS